MRCLNDKMRYATFNTGTPEGRHHCAPRAGTVSAVVFRVDNASRFTHAIESIAWVAVGEHSPTSVKSMPDQSLQCCNPQGRLGSPGDHIGRMGRVTCDAFELALFVRQTHLKHWVSRLGREQ